MGTLSENGFGCRAPKRAFTLVELLVVIVVIAVLAAMILPTLSRAKQRAHAAICQSNHRQLAIGLTLYADEYWGYPPGSAVLDGAHQKFWFNSLEPYVRSRWPATNFVKSSPKIRSVPSGVFACPGYNNISGVYSRGETFDFTDLVKEPLGAYAYNFCGVDWIEEPILLGLGSVFPEPHVGIQIIRPDKITHPSDMIAIGDAALMETLDVFSPFSFGPAFTWWGLYDPAIVKALMSSERPQVGLRRKKYGRRHADIWNMAFIDGHVEGDKPSYFFKIVNNSTRARRWNNDNQPHLDRFAPP